MPVGVSQWVASGVIVKPVHQQEIDELLAPLAMAVFPILFAGLGRQIDVFYGFHGCRILMKK